MRRILLIPAFLMLGGCGDDSEGPVIKNCTVIYGHVMDKETMRPVRGANVDATWTADGFDGTNGFMAFYTSKWEKIGEVNTDLNGYFSFCFPYMKKMNAGNFSVRVVLNDENHYEGAVQEQSNIGAGAYQMEFQLSRWHPPQASVPKRIE